MSGSFTTRKAHCPTCGAELSGGAPVEATTSLVCSVPEGWKLVPIEPTPAMIDAAQYDFRWKGEWAEHAWGLMLAAAPHPSAQARRGWPDS